MLDRVIISPLKNITQDVGHTEGPIYKDTKNLSECGTVLEAYNKLNERDYNLHLETTEHLKSNC